MNLLNILSTEASVLTNEHKGMQDVCDIDLGIKLGIV